MNNADSQTVLRRTVMATVLVFGVLAQVSAAMYETTRDVLSDWINGSGGVPPARNTAELLRRLPAELRSSFTLVYASRSPHRESVDPLHPRVVIFSPTGDLLLAFTGDPAKPGFDIVEAIQFDRSRAAFSTRKFILPDAVSRRPALAEDAAKNGVPNRTECTVCHGGDPRPLFDAYGLWPGFYGSRLDALALNPEERANYVRFLDQVSRDPGSLYAGLDFQRSAETPLGPYLDEAPVEISFKTPNTRLGMALTELNRKRLHRLISASPDYGRLKYALVSGLMGCQKLPFSKRFEQRVVELLADESAERLARSGIPAASRTPQAFQMQELIPHISRNVAEIAYVAEALRIDRRGWSLSSDVNSLSLFDGILSGEIGKKNYYVKEDFLLEMLGEMAATDPHIAERYATYRAYPETDAFGLRLDLKRISANTFCRDLASRVREEKARLPRVDRLTEWRP
jgi:hypothetical protein